MISEIYIIAGKYEVLISKSYRGIPNKANKALLINRLKEGDEGSIPPHFKIEDVHFYNIHRNGLYLVATSDSEISPYLIVEVLSRFYHVCKDFCGVVNEQSIRANVLLVYELLDEYINEGYVQLATTDKLRPYIQSEPVIVQKEKSPADDLSSRVFGIETKVTPGSSSNKPVVKAAKEGENRQNELYMGVIEKMVAVINKDGSTARIEVNGSVNIKNFLTGSQVIKVGLNEDLVVARNLEKGYGNQVQLDRCTLHKCVKEEEFRNNKVLVIHPPVGEFAAMTYSVSSDLSINQPFRLLHFIGDAQGSRDLAVTLRLRSDIPANTEALNVKVIFPVPAGVTSLSQRLDSLNQSAELQTQERQVVWKINKLPGKTETVAQFRLINQGSGKLSRDDVGPISLEFEISGYLSSGLQVKYLKILGGDKSSGPQRWVRTITASDSYIVKT